MIKSVVATAPTVYGIETHILQPSLVFLTFVVTALTVYGIETYVM